MARSFLLRFNTMDAADNILANTNYATIETRDEEQQSLVLTETGTINGVGISWREPINFLASTVKGWTLPHVITRSIPYDILGLSGNRDIDFTVDNLQTFKRKRENWIGFTVNGTRYYAKDDGGAELVPASGVEIWDFDGQNGWPLMNIKAVYDSEGNQITAPQRISGVFIVLRLVGEQNIIDDTIVDPIDDTIWETSVLAKNFQTNGVEQTYTRTAQQTDWGVGYSMTYYERTINGEIIGMADPQTLPQEILNQHGIVKTTQ